MDELAGSGFFPFPVGLDAGSVEVEREAFLAELREVAYDLGFFYLTGHGIDRPGAYPADATGVAPLLRATA
jgi:hypothetical protein